MFQQPFSQGVWQALKRLVEGKDVIDITYRDVTAPSSAAYVPMVAGTPQSLKSLCRLVISHHIGVSDPTGRKQRVKQLPLPPHLKNYVLCLDLTDPEEEMKNWE
nr:hypothetical protein BaRGS_033283 [Batillaria attramentaria]